MIRASFVLLLTLSFAACHRAPMRVSDGGPLPDGQGPRGDGPVLGDSAPLPVDHGNASWVCQTSPAGATTCKTSGGLPQGSGWRCQMLNKTWYCFGQGSASPGWGCALEAALGLWRCSKPDGADDRPPGGGLWVCWKGSQFGGTVCQQISLPPGPPSVSGPCFPGQRMWCDGLQYDGWGQVECDPATLHWKVKINDAGQKILDCREDLSGGKRPDTLCACYHFFLNPACCERVDCVVPDGSAGQICPPGPGGLCSYCNPMSSECSEPGARCIVTNAHETFCGRLCDNAKPCPPGYQCMTIKISANQTSQQCVPGDYSCYY